MLDLGNEKVAICLSSNCEKIQQRYNWTEFAVRDTQVDIVEGVSYYIHSWTTMGCEGISGDTCMSDRLVNFAQVKEAKETYQ